MLYEKSEIYVLIIIIMSKTSEDQDSTNSLTCLWRLYYTKIGVGIKPTTI